MNHTRYHQLSRIRAMTLTELVVACAIAATAMVGIAQLMYQVTRQYRLVACRNVMTQEAANVMENLMARPWHEIMAEQPPSIELSPACRQAAPDARLELKIVSEEGQPNARRITVMIHWMTHAAAETQPITLVAWRYADESQQNTSAEQREESAGS